MATPALRNRRAEAGTPAWNSVGRTSEIGAAQRTSQPNRGQPDPTAGRTLLQGGGSVSGGQPPVGGQGASKGLWETLFGGTTEGSTEVVPTLTPDQQRLYDGLLGLGGGILGEASPLTNEQIGNSLQSLTDFGRNAVGAGQQNPRGIGEVFGQMPSRDAQSGVQYTGPGAYGGPGAGTQAQSGVQYQGPGAYGGPGAGTQAQSGIQYSGPGAYNQQVEGYDPTREYTSVEPAADFNQYFDQSIQAPALQAFRENVQPAISRSFGGNALFDEDRRTADARANEDLLQSLGQQRAALGYQTRQDEIGRAHAAAMQSAGFGHEAAIQGRDLAQQQLLQHRGFGQEVGLQGNALRNQANIANANLASQQIMQHRGFGHEAGLQGNQLRNQANIANAGFGTQQYMQNQGFGHEAGLQGNQLRHSASSMNAQLANQRSLAALQATEGDRNRGLQRDLAAPGAAGQLIAALGGMQNVANAPVNNAIQNILGILGVENFDTVVHPGQTSEGALGGILDLFL